MTGGPRRIAATLTLLFLAAASPASAGEAHVTAVEATCAAASGCRFVVTVRHRDTGWDHYADGWEILGPDGALLAKRVLLHPHVNEQPFTRDLPDVRIPAGVRDVTVRAHDSVHELGGDTVTLTLPETGS